MVNGQSGIMSAPLECEVRNMVQILCTNPDCRNVKRLEFQNYKPHDTLRAVIACSCGEQIFFEMDECYLTFVSGKQIGGLSTSIPQGTRDRFVEAKLCFFSAALRASTVMARSSVESALDAKKFTAATLDDCIEEAHNQKVLGEEEYLLAHGARLVGNRAIHKEPNIRPEHAESLLVATVQILNALFP